MGVKSKVRNRLEQVMNNLKKAMQGRIVTLSLWSGFRILRKKIRCNRAFFPVTVQIQRFNHGNQGHGTTRSADMPALIFFLKYSLKHCSKEPVSPKLTVARRHRLDIAGEHELSRS